MTTTYIDTPNRSIDIDGATITYRDYGAASAVPVVFLHHFTAVIDDWDPRVVDGLAADHRVITFDNRGVGGSSGETPGSIESMAADAVAFIRALGLEKVDLLGFSMGGFVAQVVAQIAPVLVRKLILTGTGPAGGGEQGSENPDLGGLMEQVYARAAAENKHPKHYLFFTQTANGQAAADAFLARLQERQVDRVPEATQQTIQAHLAAIGGWIRGDASGLALIAQPTFIANGDDDVMVPTGRSFELLARIPNANLSIYPDAGHGGIFQWHDLFVQQALHFLAD